MNVTHSAHMQAFKNIKEKLFVLGDLRLFSYLLACLLLLNSFMTHNINKYVKNIEYGRKINSRNNYIIGLCVKKKQFHY